MHFLDVRCRCGAEYERAESDTAFNSALDTALGGAEPRDICCGICESPLETAQASTLVAYRLVIPPDAPLTPEWHTTATRAATDASAFSA